MFTDRFYVSDRIFVSDGLVLFLRPWNFVKHESCHPSPSGELSPSHETTVDNFRPPWSIKTTQTGTILKPTVEDYCKIHKKLLLVNPVENFYSMLPFDLIGTRRWNLPFIKAYMIHSTREEGLGLKNRPITGKDAFWEVSGSCPVKNIGGVEVGKAVMMVLKFGSGGRVRDGLWTAVEYTCMEKLDGDCSVIVLKCTSDKLIMLEEQVLIAEYEISRSIHKWCEVNYKIGAIQEESYTVGIKEEVNTLGWSCVRFNQERSYLYEKEKKMGNSRFDDEEVVAAVPVPVPVPVTQGPLGRNLFLAGGRKGQAGARSKQEGKGKRRQN